MEIFANNYALSIVALAIGFIAIGVSSFLHFKFKYKISLSLLILGGFILRLVISSDAYLHPHDEKFHALVAKNIIEHPLTPTLYNNPVHNVNYKDWSSNHIWLHKQPLPLWAMATSISIFGNNEFAVRFPSILLSTLGILLLYQICMFFFLDKNRRTIAWLAAFLFAINGLILELTGGRVATDHYDVFFMVLILTAIYFTIKFVQTELKIYNFSTGLLIGLAVLTKWLPAFIVLPIWILLVYDSDKFKTKQILINFTVLLATSIAIFLPWQIYIFHAFPIEAAYTSSFNLMHITEVLDNQTGPFYFFVARMGANYGELIYLALIFMIVYLVKNYRDLKILSLVVWIFIPLIFFSIAKTKMQAYILFIAPALFIVTAWFWASVRDAKINGFNKFLKYLILVLIILLPLRYSFERIKPFANENRNPEWVKTLKAMNKTEIPENSILFNFSYPIEAMFYTNLTVYSEIPDTKRLNKLIEQGYTIYLNDNKNIPTELKNDKRIRFIQLEQ